MRTLTRDQLKGRANGPFIAGEDMVSFRKGTEIKKGQQAFLLENHICIDERDATMLYAVLHRDELLD